jgi:hypothetical protein
MSDSQSRVAVVTCGSLCSDGAGQTVGLNGGYYM